jgi:hypothetical protein
MAQAQKTPTPQAAIFEPEKLVPNQRLRRALLDPEILDEFLVNPQEVAKRYNVSLTDEEITAVRNVSHVLASWDFFCGESQWLESVRFDGQTPTRSPSVADFATERVRARIAEEILRDVPRAIRRVVSEIGGETLVDPRDRLEDMPEHIQPLARTIQQLVRTLTRSVVRELSHASGSQYYAMQGRRELQQPVTPSFGQMQPYPFTDGIAGLGRAMGEQLTEMINHAAQEAIEHVRPQMARQQPRWRATQAHREPTGQTTP